MSLYERPKEIVEKEEGKRKAGRWNPEDESYKTSQKSGKGAGSKRDWDKMEGYHRHYMEHATSIVPDKATSIPINSDAVTRNRFKYPMFIEVPIPVGYFADFKKVCKGFNLDPESVIQELIIEFLKKSKVQIDEEKWRKFNAKLYAKSVD